MKETLHCPSFQEKLLTHVTGSLWNKFKLYSKFGGFPLAYGYFLSKISSKMHSQMPNTMKEAQHCAGIQKKLLIAYSQSSAQV